MTQHFLAVSYDHHPLQCSRRSTLKNSFDEIRKTEQIYPCYHQNSLEDLDHLIEIYERQETNTNNTLRIKIKGTIIFDQPESKKGNKQRCPLEKTVSHINRGQE